ncbi:MAG TPA: hypothetical protein VH083_06930 [Myxococcales bacterium]|nr:hypothetical protein [Myxococcales bacterium]
MARILSISIFVSILAACGGTSNGQTDGGPGGNSCTAGVACTPATANACQVFETACTGAVSSCVAASNLTDGTSCGSGQFCNTGVCVTGTTRTVSSTLQTRYVFDDGRSEIRPGWGPDLNITVNALLVADDADPSGYKSFPVTVAADGTFSVPDVPFGPYFIQIDLTGERLDGNNDAVFVTDRMLYEVTSSTPDLTFFNSHRPDVQELPFDSNTGIGVTVQAHVRGLVPLVDHDLFHLRSSQVGTNTGFDSGAFFPRPDAGATSIDAGMDWEIAIFQTEPSQGDSEWFDQRRVERLDGGTVIERTLAFTKITNFGPVADGGTTTLDVEFAPAPMTGSLDADFRFSQFNALAKDVHPGSIATQADGPELLVNAVAHGFDFPHQPGSSLTGPPLLLFAFNSNFGVMSTQENTAQAFLLEAP